MSSDGSGVYLFANTPIGPKYITSSSPGVTSLSNSPHLWKFTVPASPSPSLDNVLTDGKTVLYMTPISSGNNLSITSLDMYQKTSSVANPLFTLSQPGVNIESQKLLTGSIFGTTYTQVNFNDSLVTVLKHNDTATPTKLIMPADTFTKSPPSIKPTPGQRVYLEVLDLLDGSTLYIASNNGETMFTNTRGSPLNVWKFGNEVNGVINQIISDDGTTILYVESSGGKILSTLLTNFSNVSSEALPLILYQRYSVGCVYNGNNIQGLYTWEGGSGSVHVVNIKSPSAGIRWTIIPGVA
jgi:hypothetical protein